MSELIRKMRIQRDELDPDIISDFSFIVGDMNYRLDSTFEELIGQMETIIEKRKELDQLHIACTKYDKYPGYQEYEINFMPSYKRNRFDNNYFNKKNQAPSYTDRVLMKNNTNQNVQLQGYTCLDQVFGSDHRPVVLDISVDFKPVRYLNLARLTD